MTSSATHVSPAIAERRKPGLPAGELRLLECAVDRARGRIVRPDGATHVEPRVMDVLFALAAGAGCPLSRDEIIEAAWGHPHVTDEALSRCISLLRQALRDDPRKPRFIETLSKRGYRLLAPLEARVAAPTRLAVLPFVNLSGTSAYEHLADGLTELLISHVACLPAVSVASRTSSMHFKDSHLRVSEIARELGATRVVEGSVLASVDAVQAVLQLIDPVTDTHLLARSYIRRLGDPLVVQNDLAAEMATALEPALAS